MKKKSYINDIKQNTGNYRIVICFQEKYPYSIFLNSIY